MKKNGNKYKKVLTFLCHFSATTATVLVDLGLMEQIGLYNWYKTCNIVNDLNPHVGHCTVPRLLVGVLGEQFV